MIPKTLYKHPDGFEIKHYKGALIASDDSDNFVVIPIGLGGLKELIEHLQEVDSAPPEI